MRSRDRIGAPSIAKTGMFSDTEQNTPQGLRGAAVAFAVTDCIA